MSGKILRHLLYFYTLLPTVFDYAANQDGGLPPALDAFNDLFYSTH